MEWERGEKTSPLNEHLTATVPSAEISLCIRRELTSIYSSMNFEKM